MFESQLEGIGLTKGEIKVYLTLLKIGETTTGKIIDESGLSSGKIYEILDKLIKKGLATYILKEKTKHFSATTPKKILEYVERKKEETEAKKKEVEKVLPQLINLHKLGKKMYSAVIYKGLEGFKTAIFEQLEELSKGGEYLAFGTSTKRPKNVLRVWKQFERIRIRNKIKTKAIVVSLETYEQWFKNKPFTQTRLLNISECASISISKDNVIIHNYLEDLSLIKIRSATIAKSFREFFYSLWAISKKLK